MFAYVSRYGKLAGGEGCLEHLGRQSCKRCAEGQIAAASVRLVMSAILTTQRLRLRPIDVDDIDTLHVFWTNPDVRRYLWDDKIIPREFVEEIVATSQQSFAERDYGFWGLSCSMPSAVKGSSASAGIASSRMANRWSCSTVSCPCTGVRVLAPRRVTKSFGGGFEHCAIDRVIAATDTPNQRSVRVLQRLA